MPPPVVAYGGLYSETTQVITVPDNGTPVAVALPEAMQARNVTPGVNSLTLAYGGVYKIDLSAIMGTSTAPLAVVLAVRVNGNAVIPALALGTLLSGTIRSYATSAIVPLSAGDVLDVVLYSAAGGTVYLGPAQNASLVVTRLGDRTI